MGDIYFLARTYSPNAASDIRYRSFLSGFKGETKISFVYFIPDADRSKFTSPYDNIDAIHLWENKCPSNKILRHLFFYYQLLKFVIGLKNDDVVVDLACCEMLPILFLKKGLKVYYEISEHPEISLYSTKLFAPSVEKFCSQCKRLTDLFVISNALKDYFIEKGVDSERIHVINMTVDDSRFQSLCKNEGKDRYIAYCGTASNNKDGVDQLIRSFSIVSKQYTDVKLYIIGKTPNKNQAFSNGNLVKELNLEEKVIFTGAVPYTDVPQLLMDAEILALDRPDNKQAKYGFPTKLGEYLMTGNPVVITHVGDIPLFLTDNETALIAAPDNEISFAEKLIWALENPAEAKDIGIQGRQLAMKCFNGTIEGNKIMQIIKNQSNGTI